MEFIYVFIIAILNVNISDGFWIPLSADNLSSGYFLHTCNGFSMMLEFAWLKLLTFMHVLKHSMDAQINTINISLFIYILLHYWNPNCRYFLRIFNTFECRQYVLGLCFAHVYLCFNDFGVAWLKMLTFIYVFIAFHGCSDQDFQ